MATKAQRTGMRAVYLVAAEIVAQGFVVSPTSRNAFGADLLVTDESCRRACSVQVKANSRIAPYWLLSEKAKDLASDSHVYVFVNLASEGMAHEYFVVPSSVVAERVRTDHNKNSVWHYFTREDALGYRDSWHVLGCGTLGRGAEA